MLYLQFIFDLFTGVNDFAKHNVQKAEKIASDMAAACVLMGRGKVDGFSLTKGQLDEQLCC